MKNKHILITGGAGFIGSHLTDYYLAKGDEVTVIDNLSTGKIENLHLAQQQPKFTFYHADVLKFTKLKEVVEKSDIIFNLAAMVGMFNVIENPIKTIETNIGIAERLLSIIANLKKKPTILLASSSEVYGSKSTTMKETDPLVIDSALKSHASYPISKLCNEISGIAYYKEKKVPVIVTRIFNTVGPRQTGQYGMVLPRFVQQAMKNEPLTIFGDGHQTRSFCDVRRLTTMLDELTTTKESIGQIINVGGDTDISILKLAELVKTITKSTSASIFKSYEDVFGHNYLIIEHRKPDLSLVKKIIKNDCKSDLATAILDVFIYFKKNKLST